MANRLKWTWIILAILLIAAGWFVFSSGFFPNLRVPPSSTSTPNRGGAFTPNGYRGPSGTPHVNGPSGPPPNY